MPSICLFAAQINQIKAESGIKQIKQTEPEIPELIHEFHLRLAFINEFDFFNWRQLNKAKLINSKKANAANWEFIESELVYGLHPARNSWNWFAGWISGFINKLNLSWLPKSTEMKFD